MISLIENPVNGRLTKNVRANEQTSRVWNSSGSSNSKIEFP